MPRLGLSCQAFDATSLPRYASLSRVTRALRAYGSVPNIAKNVCFWGRHHRTKVDPGVAMPYFCALRSQKYGIFTRVNFCTMVTPPNANIFGTLSFGFFWCVFSTRRSKRGHSTQKVETFIPSSPNNDVFDQIHKTDMAVCQKCLHLGASPSHKSLPG